MNFFHKHRRLTGLLLCVVLMASVSGCTTLKPGEYERFGYHGDPIVKEGARVIPIDWLGNLFGVVSKIILWNWKIKRHHILEPTEQAVAEYLAANPDLGNVQVQLNRYAPQDAWRRLFKNKGVKWPYRFTFGIFTVLIIDTLMINRIFAGDYYNPYTHTVNVFSDIPAVALHELGHAKDFSRRRYRGSYALFRILPGADLFQEVVASKEAFRYTRSKRDIPQEIEEFKVLYPAFGTYAGGYLPVMGGTVIGAIVGHIVGRIKAGKLERRTRLASVQKIA